MPNGPKWNDPASRSNRLPKMRGESKLGTQSHSTFPSRAISAPVWQSDRNAYSSMGGNGVSASTVRPLVSGLVGALARARDTSSRSGLVLVDVSRRVAARAVPVAVRVDVRVARRGVFFAG